MHCVSAYNSDRRAPSREVRTRVVASPGHGLVGAWVLLNPERLVGTRNPGLV